MNITIQTALPSIGVSLEFFFIVQLVEGFVLSFVNFSLILAIMLSRRARNQKEFIIMCGKIFADGWYGLGYFVWGIFGLVAKERVYSLYHFTRLHCLFNVFENTMFVFAAPLVGLAITMVSLDRLLAACKPTWYFTLGLKYAWKMNGVLYTICFTGLVLAYALAIADGDQLNPTAGCSTQSAAGGLWSYLRAIRFSGAAVGISLYVPILFLLYRRKNLWALNKGKKMLQVTITIGLTALSDFFLFLIPEFFVMTNLLQAYSEFCYLAMVSKGTVNMFIYTFRHKELKKAIMEMFNLRCTQTSSTVVRFHKRSLTTD